MLINGRMVYVFFFQFCSHHVTDKPHFSLRRMHLLTYDSDLIHCRVYCQNRHKHLYLLEALVCFLQIFPRTQVS